MKRVLNITKFVVKYPGYLIFGFLSMILYAGFSGVSITLAIPLFDDIFVRDNNIDPIYNTISSFFSAINNIITTFLNSNKFYISLSVWQSLWFEIKEILSLSCPWMLLKIVSTSLLILILLKNIFYILNRMMFVNLRGRVIKDLRNACYKSYLAQSYLFFNENRVGDSIVRMINDIDIVNNLFINSLYKIFRDFTVVLVYALLALSINFKLFCVSLLILPTFAFCVNYITKKIRKYAKKIQSQLSEMFSSIEEVLNSMRIVKVFRKENHEFKRMEAINNNYFNYWRRSEIYTSFALPLSEVSSIIIGIIILFIGGVEIINEYSSFSFGNFVAFLLAVFSMMHPLKGIANDLTDMRRGIVSVDRVSEILELKSDIIEATDAISKEDFNDKIEFCEVNFGYLKNRPVLKNCNLIIKKNEKIAFVGSSGSGKTTLINLINRMYEVDSGEILIDKIPIKSIKVSDLRKLFGIVTQESILFSESIENNIKYGSNELKTIDDVVQACKYAYADEFINNLPDKYNTMILPRGSNLSGGQKQRLCIARAIIGNPPILIFDEATSSLDTDSEQKVQKAIDASINNRTVIVIAHRLSTILSADKIFVLDKGEIIGVGKHENLLNTCPKYKTFFDLQFNNKTKE